MICYLIAAPAHRFGGDLERKITEDLRHFQRMVETRNHDLKTWV